MLGKTAVLETAKALLLEAQKRGLTSFQLQTNLKPELVKDGISKPKLNDYLTWLKNHPEWGFDIKTGASDAAKQVAKAKVELKKQIANGVPLEELKDQILAVKNVATNLRQSVSTKAGQVKDTNIYDVPVDFETIPAEYKSAKAGFPSWAWIPIALTVASLAAAVLKPKKSRR